MDFSLTKPYHIPDDAVWLITGCSSGIGHSLAKLIANHSSHRLVATARKISSLSAVPDSSRVLKLELDVTAKASVDAAISSALEKFGRLDIVVNNAGYALNGDTENATEEQERRVIETLFWGTVRVTKHAMRIMREENPKTGQLGGVVLNVTSAGGFVAFPGSAFYHAGKFAVEGFTESVAKEVRPEWNINFCIIEPGGTQTNLFGTSSADDIQPLAAYEFQDSPSRIVAAYVNDPTMRELWAHPDDIATGMMEVVGRGQRIPIRVPLGPDVWHMLKTEVETIGKELDLVRELSENVGHPDQYASMRENMKRTD